MIVGQPFYSEEIIIEQPLYSQDVIIVNNNTFLDIAENKLLNPEYNSFANCKELCVQSSPILNEEFFIYNSANAALCPDHLHLNQETIPLSQIDKVKAFPEHVQNTFYKIKVAHFGSNKFIAAEMKPFDVMSPMPDHYRWFSNIIVSRLKHKGMNVPDCAINDENTQLTGKL